MTKEETSALLDRPQKLARASVSLSVRYKERETEELSAKRESLLLSPCRVLW
jgi:hypothetical protein